MFHYIYTQSPVHICLWILILYAVWGYISTHTARRLWLRLNLCSILLSTIAILYTTILSRTPGAREVILIPFAALRSAGANPERFRSAFMNVFLFFPLGLSLSNALPHRWHRWGRIALTTSAACLFSIAIEYTQYHYALGLAETDDVICNTLGAFIGSTSLLLAHAIEIHKERRIRKSMTLTANETQFLQIAKAAVSGGDLPADSVDWQAMFTLAGQQKLLPILFEAVRKSPAADENTALFAVVKQQVIGQVLSQTVRAVEFVDLYGKLRAAGLHPIVVKGALSSRLYPLKDHRISADDDIHIPDGEFLKCHEQLLAAGLTTETAPDELPTADEVSYTKKDSPLYIELPASVVLEITYTEPGLQGDRSTGGTKPATVETGYEIQVPLFLETGTKVKVDTRTGEYLGRVND